MSKQVCVVQAQLTSFRAAARLQLRTCLADQLHLPLISVTIQAIKSGQSNNVPAACCQQEGAVNSACGKNMLARQGSANSRPGAAAAAHAAVQPLSDEAPSSGVTVAVHTQLGSAQVQGQQLAAALQTAPDTVLTEQEMNACVGAVHAGSLQAVLVDVTPGLACDSSPTRQAGTSVPPQEATPPSTALVEVRVRCYISGRAIGV